MMTARDQQVYGLATLAMEELQSQEKALRSKKRMSQSEHYRLHLIWSAMAHKRACQNKIG